MKQKRLSKWVCVACGWRGKDDELLEAKSPFRDDDVLIACPSCKLTDGFTEACDMEDCWCDASGGYPMKNGSMTFSGDDTRDDYLRTCSKHAPNVELKGAPK